MAFRRAFVQRPYPGTLQQAGALSSVPSIAVDGMNADVDAVDASVWWDARPCTVRGTVRMGEFSAAGSTGPAAGFSTATVYIGELRAARPRLQPGQDPVGRILGATRLPGVLGAGLAFPTSTPGATAPRSFVFRDDAVTRVWRSYAFPSVLVYGAQVENFGDAAAAVGAVVVSASGSVSAGGDSTAGVGAPVDSASAAITLAGDSVVVVGAVVVSVAGTIANGSDALVGAGAIIVDGVAFIVEGADVVVAEGEIGGPSVVIASPLSLVLVDGSVSLAVADRQVSAAVTANGALIGISTSSAPATVDVADKGASLVLLTEPTE